MESILAGATSILFHGLAYGMVLYLISVGLSITMGLMNFANLAHGVFAMLGGYLALELMRSAQVPFVVALLLASALIALLSVVLERLLYRRLYGRSDLEQVLLTMGLIFVAMAVARYCWGPLPQRANVPEMLTGQVWLFGREFPTYRLFLVLSGFAIFAALWLAIDKTGMGAKLRAAVDNKRMAEAVGINTSGLFTVTFAFGSGLAALGGGLGAEILAVNPSYAMEYLVYFLIVVAVGGMGSVKGPFLAAILLGVSDTACKYLIPEFGGFFIFLAMMLLLLWRPQGLLGRA